MVQRAEEIAAAGVDAIARSSTAEVKGGLCLLI